MRLFCSDEFFVFFHTSFVVSVLLCFVREQRRKKTDQKREKTEKKEDRKKTKKSPLSRRQQNESKKRLLSPYIYTHTSLRTESVHNREGTLSLSLSFTALFLYIS